MELAERTKPFIRALVAAALALTTAACGGAAQSSDSDIRQDNGAATGDAQEQSAPDTARKPLELTVYVMYGGVSHDLFMESSGNLIRKKYPHLTFRVINANAKEGTDLQSIVAAKTEIDLYFATTGLIHSAIEAGLGYDISDLADKHGVPVGGFQEAPLDMLRHASGGKLLGWPSKINSPALFYNKDLFDKFGVPYLIDGMSWDDVYETARRMTRQDGSVQYRGFGIGNLSAVLNANPFSLTVVDAKTHKATIDDDRWKSIFRQFTRFYELPGYGSDKALLSGTMPKDLFIKDRTTAIFATMNSEYVYFGDMNWDAVTYPSFKPFPGPNVQPSPVYLLLSANSSHKDEAFLAMSRLVAEDVQMERSRQGSPTVLKSEAIRSAYGSDLPALQGKNAKALVPPEYVRANLADRYTGQADLIQPFISVATGEKDLNTALREAEEETNKKIQALGQ